MSAYVMWEGVLDDFVLMNSNLRIKGWICAHFMDCAVQSFIVQGSFFFVATVDCGMVFADAEATGKLKDIHVGTQENKLYSIKERRNSCMKGDISAVNGRPVKADLA